MVTSQEELMQAFDFTEEDLDANRHGLISEHQRERLRGMARGVGGCSVKSSLIAMGFVFFGFCLILALFLKSESSWSALFSDLQFVGLLGLSLLVALAAIAGGTWWTRRQAEGLTKVSLRKIEGKAKVTEEYFRRVGSGYRVKIGEKEFKFLEEYGRYFQDGVTYRIYYCRSGAFEPILSIEGL